MGKRTKETDGSKSRDEDPIRALIRQLIREELKRAAAGIEADPFVPLKGTIPDASDRKANRIGRSGAIEGARKVGRTWVARKSAIESWIASQRGPEVDDGEGDEVDRELARAGWQ